MSPSRRTDWQSRNATNKTVLFRWWNRDGRNGNKRSYSRTSATRSNCATTLLIGATRWSDHQLKIQFNCCDACHSTPSERASVFPTVLPTFGLRWREQVAFRCRSGCRKPVKWTAHNVGALLSIFPAWWNQLFSGY